MTDPVLQILRLLRLIALALFAIIALMITARAQEPEEVLAEAQMGQGGLICDTQQQVLQFIILQDAGVSPLEAIRTIDGCGVLTRPQLMKVIAVGTHTTEAHKYLLCRYEFLGSDMPPQYGIAARKSLGQPV